MSWRAPLAAIAVLGACSVNITDYRGRACDATHGCVDGWACVNGFCTADAGTADSGVVWRQWVDGFTSFTLQPSACCTLDAGSGADGNTVTAHADTAGGTALANGSFSMDPQQGQLRGHLLSTLALPDGANPELVRVTDNAGAEVLRLFLGSAGALSVNSPPGTLDAAEVNDTGTIPGFTAGGDYLVEISWVRGNYRTVSVNGAQLFTRTLSQATSLSSLTGVSLGVVTDAGLGDPEKFQLWRWQLATDPTATLSE